MSGVGQALLWLERLADRLLPAAPAARAVLIPALLMGFYAAFNAWAFAAAGPIDFPVYYLGAVSFLEGGIPYGMAYEEFRAFGLERLGLERFGYPYYYPPLVAALVAPLTQLPVIAAAWVWNMANAAAVVAGTALLLGERRWRAQGLLAWGLTAAFVPTLATLYAGQISGLLYLSVAAAIVAHERGRPMAAGAAVAFGAALKVVPVVLIGYFAWRGDWRAVAGSLVGAAVIVVATLPLAGLDGWIAYFTVGLGTMHSPSDVAGATNVTLNGAILRMLGDGAPGLARALWIGASAVVVLATVAACWPPFRDARSLRFEVVLILLALQLIAPYTWYLQLTFSLLPAAIVILMAWRSGVLGACWIWGLLGIVALVDVFGLAWHRFEDSAFVLSLPLLVVLALWAALCVAAFRSDGLGEVVNG